MEVHDEEGLWRYFADPNVRFPRRPNWLCDVGIVQLPHDLGYRFTGAPVRTIVQGGEVSAVLPFLLEQIDGTRGIPEILAALPADLSRRATLKTLQVLHSSGLLVEALERDAAAPNGIFDLKERESLFWSRHMSITGAVRDEAQFRRILSDAEITLIGTGLLGASMLHALGTAGIQHVSCIAWSDDGYFTTAAAATSDPISASTREDLEARLRTTLVSGFRDDSARQLILVATRNAPRELLRSISRQCLHHRRQLLVCNEVDAAIELGPLIQPYSSACFHCLEIREMHSGHHSVEEHFFHQLLMSGPNSEWVPRGESALVSGLIAHIVVMEVVRVITGIAQPTLVNRVLSVSPVIGEIRSNTVMRVPWCPECGGGTNDAPRA